MASKLALVVALASLFCLGLVATALAVPQGVTGKRTAEPLARTAATSALIASASACPTQTSLASPPAAQEQAMLCMTNFARAGAGLGPLGEAEPLGQSAREKAADVIRCDSFSHFACGRDFTYWMRAAGYIGDQCWRAGENLAWGSGEYGSVRSIFRAWMSSPTHRRNVFGDYDEVGIGLVAGAVEGHDSARVWAAHFGSHC
jgi:uncharacterized protein YkwD